MVFSFSPEFEYYLKVFLNQPVDVNLDWDLKMTKSLGEIYPRAIKDLAPYVYIPEIITIMLPYHYRPYFEAFLQGVNPVEKVALSTWSERITAVDNWLQTLPMKFTDAPDVLAKENQKVYEAAVDIIEKQNLSEYLFLFNFAICLKLSKEQYLRFLKFHVCYLNIENEHFLDILKGEIGNPEIASPHEYRHSFFLEFPQIFLALGIKSIDDLDSLNITFTLEKILKHYALTLFVKYYKKLSLDFFADSIKVNLKELPAPTASEKELERYAEALFTPFDIVKLEYLLFALSD